MRSTLILFLCLTACSGVPKKPEIRYTRTVEVIGRDSTVEGHRLDPAGAWGFYNSKHAEAPAALAEQAVTNFKESETFRADEAKFIGYQFAGAVALSSLSPTGNAMPPPQTNSGRSPRQQEAFVRGLQQLKAAAKLYNEGLFPVPETQ